MTDEQKEPKMIQQHSPPDTVSFEHRGCPSYDHGRIHAALRNLLSTAAAIADLKVLHEIFLANSLAIIGIKSGRWKLVGK
jgi:hypothetical protein